MAANWTSLPLDEQIALVEREINAAHRSPYVPTIYPGAEGDERLGKLKALRRKLLDRRDST